MPENPFTLQDDVMSAIQVQVDTAVAGVVVTPPSESIWAGIAPVGAVATDNTTDLELGMRWRALVNGAITAIRFYKSAADTRLTRNVHLWTNAGVSLGSATSENEPPGPRWIDVPFAEPITVQPNVTYVVTTNTRYYMATTNGHATAFSTGHLRAMADGADGPNGVFNNTPGNFPGSTFNSTNYWLDVLFAVSTYVADTTTGLWVTKTSFDIDGAGADLDVVLEPSGEWWANDFEWDGVNKYAVLKDGRYMCTVNFRIGAVALTGVPAGTAHLLTWRTNDNFSANNPILANVAYDQVVNMTLWGVIETPSDVYLRMGLWGSHAGTITINEAIVTFQYFAPPP